MKTTYLKYIEDRNRHLSAFSLKWNIPTITDYQETRYGNGTDTKLIQKLIQKWEHPWTVCIQPLCWSGSIFLFAWSTNPTELFHPHRGRTRRNRIAEIKHSAIKYLWYFTAVKKKKKSPVSVGKTFGLKLGRESYLLHQHHRVELDVRNFTLLISVRFYQTSAQ